jgi:polar amino acid transport system permease protein
MRVLLVVGVVAGLYLVLGVARLTRLIDPVLWTLLQNPLSIGIQNTILFSVSVIALGTGIGFLAGWARVSGHPLLSWPAAAFVDVFRGLPPLVLILFAYFWLPFVLETDTYSSGLTFAVIALALHSGAYQAEIFRAGFQSVPRGQIEAAEAMGLSPGQSLQFVILPQTFRVTLPALGNEFANVIKDTSLLAAIGAADLVYWGRNSAGSELALPHIEWVFAIWIIIALLYFIITYVITQAVAAVEEHFRVPGLGSVAF